MKNTIKVIGISLLLLIIMASCARGLAASIKGKWVVTKFEMSGEDLIRTVEEMTNQEIDLENMFYCEFTEDGNYKLVMEVDEKVDALEGTYKVNRKKISMEYDGKMLEGTLAGNTLTLKDKEEEISMVFTKK